MPAPPTEEITPTTTPLAEEPRNPEFDSWENKWICATLGIPTGGFLAYVVFFFMRLVWTSYIERWLIRKVQAADARTRAAANARAQAANTRARPADQEGIEMDVFNESRPVDANSQEHANGDDERSSEFMEDVAPDFITWGEFFESPGTLRQRGSFVREDRDNASNERPAEEFMMSGALPIGEGSGSLRQRRSFNNESRGGASNEDVEDSTMSGASPDGSPSMLAQHSSVNGEDRNDSSEGPWHIVV